MLDAEGDCLNEICIHLAARQGKDHVIGHRIVLEGGMGHLIHDEFLIEDGGLDTDVLSIQIGKGLDVRSKDCRKQGQQYQKYG